MDTARDIKMPKNLNRQRRRLLISAAGLLLAAPATAARPLLMATPEQTAGPFYPVELPLDDDNDLTQVEGQRGRAKGRITDLTGRILNINDQPLKRVRIEIWQCDINGRYRHPHDRSDKPVDENFQGHGHTISTVDGRYRFRTIRPVPYPGRTPHIHMAIFPPGERPFVTQLYIKGESRNNQDFIFSRISVERRALVMADFLPTIHNNEIELTAHFDIVLDRMTVTHNRV